LGGELVTENEVYGHTFPIVFSYTILLIRPDRKYNPPFEAGAGVYVQIGGRHFIATAAHCMKEKVLIANEKGFEFPSKRTVTILNRGTDEDIDIGFLEIKPDEQFTALGRSFCSIDQIALSDLMADDMHHIVGYPVGHWKQKGVLTELVKCGFGSQFQEKEGEYLIFPFPKKEDWFRPVGDSFEKSTFIETPNGFSGGGLWAFTRVPEGELFVPAKHIKLRGIQSAWWIERRLLKCVPIQRWLELIHNEYPDLRLELEAKCPSLPV
jgi:hypothetical protein